MENKEIKIRPFFVKCAVIEAITVGLIVLTVLAISLFSKTHKKKMKNWYERYVLEDTSADEVISGEDTYEV
ncbi:MAG: hypothetical protein J5766_00245 [Clostridia bacterium]|nr:hypothetical protein [Clostridia bacterium]